jgi:hypothetical protein
MQMCQELASLATDLMIALAERPSQQVVTIEYLT